LILCASWAGQLGELRRAGVEWTSSYGAALSRCLLARHIEVFDVNRPDRSARRRRGKSDPVDAQAAARAVLSGRVQARAKSGDGPVQCARMFKLARDSTVKARTQAINQLKAVLVTADAGVREGLAGLNNPALIRACTRLHADDDGDAVVQATRFTLCLLAQRIEQLTVQMCELQERLAGLVEHNYPQLLTPVGIGPNTAVTLLITMGDNPERLVPHQATFALFPPGGVSWC
jgi:transposase